MDIFSESEYEDLAATGDQAERIYKTAIRLAASGIRLAPAHPFDEKEYNKARAEARDDPKLNHGHFNRYGGKAVIGGGYKSASANMADISRWWHPATGKYRGNNICVVAGAASGIVVLDIDVKEGVDGWSWWNELTYEHGDVDTFRVRSGGLSDGGQHLYFKYREGIDTKRDGIAPGVDVRAGDNSHVMSPLSRCQGVYEVISFHPVADMPDWLFEVLTQSRKPVVDGNTRVKSTIPLSEIEIALSYLDPVEVDAQWKQICYAIHSEHPTDEGLELLQQWSSQDPERYDAANNASIWQRASDERPNGVTVGTLLGLAADYGYIDPRSGPKKLGVGTAVRRMNDAFATIDATKYYIKAARNGKPIKYIDSPCYCPSGICFKLSVDFDTGERVRGIVEEVSLAHIADATASYIAIRPAQPGEKSDKLIPLIKVWQTSQIRRYWRGIGYYVNDSRCPHGVVNLFPGWHATPKPGVPVLFIDHLKRIICNGDEERYHWLINRLAWIVQCGDQICGTIIVFRGDQGTGKTITGEYLRTMLGHRNSLVLNDAASLKTQFSEELVGKFLVEADEAIFSGNNELHNKIKSVATSTVMRDEGKNKSVKHTQNVMTLMMFSNEHQPVVVEKGDRRHTIMQVNSKYAASKRDHDQTLRREADAYFDALADEMHGDGPDMLLDMLLKWKLDASLARRALSTPEKQELAEQRRVSTDSMLDFMFDAYISDSYRVNPDASADPNPSQRHWSRSNIDRDGEIELDAFYNEYKEWVSDGKDNHRYVSARKAENKSNFSQRLVSEFRFERRVRSRRGGRSFMFFPTLDTIGQVMMERMPEATSQHQDMMDNAREVDTKNDL